MIQKQACFTAFTNQTLVGTNLTTGPAKVGSNGDGDRLRSIGSSSSSPSTLDVFVLSVCEVGSVRITWPAGRAWPGMCRTCDIIPPWLISTCDATRPAVVTTPAEATWLTSWPPARNIYAYVMRGRYSIRLFTFSKFKPIYICITYLGINIKYYLNLINSGIGDGIGETKLYSCKNEQPVRSHIWELQCLS